MPYRENVLIAIVIIIVICPVVMLIAPAAKVLSPVAMVPCSCQTQMHHTGSNHDSKK